MKVNKTHRYFTMKIITLVFLLTVTSWAMTAGGAAPPAPPAIQACLMCGPLQTACVADGGVLDFCVTTTEDGASLCRTPTPVANQFITQCTAQGGEATLIVVDPATGESITVCHKDCD
jgi:putative hemolysin